jgi:hypothetical protein
MTLSAREVLDREFLPLRAKLLEIGAMLDRMDRADGSISDDARLEKIRRGISLLNTNCEDRAEQLQLLFSLPYDPQWKKKFGIGNNSPSNGR